MSRPRRNAALKLGARSAATLPRFGTSVRREFGGTLVWHAECTRVRAHSNPSHVKKRCDRRIVFSLGHFQAQARPKGACANRDQT